MHMTTIRLYIIVQFLTLYTFSSYAQYILSNNTNGLRPYDVVTRETIVPISIGDSGENVEWDFSEIVPISKDMKQYMNGEGQDTSLVYAYEPNIIRKYQISVDTLKCIGYESNLKYINYTEPIIERTFPFSYGDHIRSRFCGNGQYCGTNRIDIKGEVIVEADGYGNIILKDDTIFNVLRIHSIQISSINMNLLRDSTIFDPQNLKQKIEETYQWYAKGYRYPLFEVETTTLYNNLQAVSTNQKAYCSLSDFQNKVYTENNENSNKKDNNIFLYKIVCQGGEIQLIYSLEKDANINVLLSDRMGIVHRNYAIKQMSGYEHKISIPYNSLTPGIYILYINVNGLVYNEKIKI